MTSHVTALVIETNYLIASAIEVPLTDHGFKVIIAITEAEIRAAIATSQIQIAIIDFRIHHSSPGGLIAWLDAAKVPYVFCTAATTAEVVKHFPGSRIIEKPFVTDQLLSLVAQAMTGPTDASNHL